MTDWTRVQLPKFVMRHLEPEAPTGVDFLHHKFFDFVNFDSDTSIMCTPSVRKLVATATERSSTVGL